MSDLDVIQLPGTNLYARRVFVKLWQAAGSPPLRSAGRLKFEQKDLYDGWQKGLPGYNPADNPDDPNQRLAHVRFVAGDLANPARDAAACERAGLVRPYSYEPWHVELPGDPRRFALVTSIPTNPNTEGDLMSAADDVEFIKEQVGGSVTRDTSLRQDVDDLRRDVDWLKDQIGGSASRKTSLRQDIDELLKAVKR